MRFARHRGLALSAFLLLLSALPGLALRHHLSQTTQTFDAERDCEHCIPSAAIKHGWPADVDDEPLDWREDYGSCVAFHPQNQGKCATCWAFGIAAAVSARLCIATEKEADVFLSPLEMLAGHKRMARSTNAAVPYKFNRSTFMTWETQSAYGAETFRALEAMETHAVPSMGCAPYTCTSWTDSASPEKKQVHRQAILLEEIKMLDLDKSAKNRSKDAKARADERYAGRYSLWRRVGAQECGDNADMSVKTRVAPYTYMMGRSVARFTDEERMGPSFWDGGPKKDDYYSPEYIQAHVPVWKQIMSEVRRNGPIPVEFNAFFSEERNYAKIDVADGIVFALTRRLGEKNGMLGTGSTSENVNHVMSLIGWGTAVKLDGSKIRYWLVQNSWGDDWNEGGFIRFFRGNKGSTYCDVFYQNWPVAWRTFGKGVLAASPSDDSIQEWRQLNARCQSSTLSTPVCMHGELMRSCKCRCHGLFTGPRCDKCNNDACNRGTQVMDKATCTCHCKLGSWGEKCSHRVNMVSMADDKVKVVTSEAEGANLMFVEDPCLRGECEGGVAWQGNKPTAAMMSIGEGGGELVADGTVLTCGVGSRYAIFLVTSHHDEFGSTQKLYHRLLPGRLCDYSK